MTVDTNIFVPQSGTQDKVNFAFYSYGKIAYVYAELGVKACVKSITNCLIGFPLPVSYRAPLIVTPGSSGIFSYCQCLITETGNSWLTIETADGQNPSNIEFVAIGGMYLLK